jgi:hypothetical protein
MTNQTKTNIFRMPFPDGTVHETEITESQALDLAAHKAIAYFPRDQRVLVDGDGTITFRQSAIPRPDAA